MDMKRVLTLMFAMFVVATFSVQLLSAQDKKAKIDAPKMEYDFGTIKESNGNVSHVFEIKNIGTAPLVITRVLFLRMYYTKV